jgi:hypothetical protein
MAQPPNLCEALLQLVYHLQTFESTLSQTLRTLEATSRTGKAVEFHFDGFH